jgi:hypothetical protein
MVILLFKATGSTIAQFTLDLLRRYGILPTTLQYRLPKQKLELYHINRSTSRRNAKAVSKQPFLPSIVTDNDVISDHGGWDVLGALIRDMKVSR